MTKNDLAHIICDGRDYITLEVAECIADDIVKRMQHELASGFAAARITGLGRFKSVILPPCRRHNPRTGGTIDIPARLKIRFTPLTDLLAKAEFNAGMGGEAQ